MQSYGLANPKLLSLYTRVQYMVNSLWVIEATFLIVGGGSFKYAKEKG